MPYGRCAIYSFEGDEQEVIEKSRVGIVPIFKQQQGFIAYGVMVQNGQIISMSAWDSEGDARPQMRRRDSGSPRTSTPRSSATSWATTRGWSSPSSNRPHCVDPARAAGANAGSVATSNSNQSRSRRAGPCRPQRHDAHHCLVRAAYCLVESVHVLGFDAYHLALRQRRFVGHKPSSCHPTPSKGPNGRGATPLCRPIGAAAGTVGEAAVHALRAPSVNTQFYVRPGVDPRH